MKNLISFIIFGVTFLWSEPKVIGIFGNEPWSKELRDDVWETPSFQVLLTEAQIAKEEQTANPTELETPVLILYSSLGEEIGRLGFLVIPTEKYVSLFQEMLSIHERCQNTEKLSFTQLLQFYRKCQLLNMTACEEKILAAGLAKDTGIDFLLEQYAKVVKKHPKQAQKIKAEIRLRKPNSVQIEWQLALLSFQSRAEKLRGVDDIVKPLTRYLSRYGDQDKESRWRCHLLLAEFYKDKNLLEKAQYHASLAIAEAPEELKQMITPLGIK
ncbi:MAG TPA: hypothetical protein VFU89_00025 [Rhabdochlamydiaceae bacterium]|nr:hypothetical protein [Rhabdochlamydiaceae bacterium]